MPALRYTNTLGNNVVTTDGTKTLVCELDIPVNATQVAFSADVIARDDTGATQYQAWKKGSAYRNSNGITTLSETPKDVVAPSLLGLLLGLLSSNVGISISTSGSKVQFFVTGKANAKITWRVRVTGVYN